MRFFNQILVLLAGLVLLPTAALSESVEIYLADKLDGNLNHYCLDMVGFQTRADPEGNLQTHTCYSYQGELAVDQTMDTANIEKGMLKVDAFEVCATIEGTTGGSLIGLAPCSDNEMQKITMNEAGQIIPEAAPSMCFTSGISSWAGGRNGDSPHQIRTLNLQPCSDEAVVYQTWATRTEFTE